MVIANNRDTIRFMIPLLHIYKRVSHLTGD
jgi:hypothetical protein